jgi:hypothetical protein
MTEEELRAKQAEKKQKQHEAWKRWYDSPKGAAWRARQKEKRSKVNDETIQSPQQQ